MVEVEVERRGDRRRSTAAGSGCRGGAGVAQEWRNRQEWRKDAKGKGTPLPRGV